MSSIVIDLQDEILPMRDKIAQEKKPGVIKALLVGRYCTLSSAAESVFLFFCLNHIIT